jgi:hypothetical protein
VLAVTEEAVEAGPVFLALGIINTSVDIDVWRRPNESNSPEPEANPGDRVIERQV